MRRLHSIGAKFALLAVALGVAIVLVEWTSMLIYRQRRGESFSRQQIQARLGAAGGSETQPEDTVRLPNFVANKALHPYLGYVFDRAPDSEIVNRFGFRGRSPLEARADGEIVVAVIGGSVAMKLPHETLERELGRLPPTATARWPWSTSG